MASIIPLPSISVAVQDAATTLYNNSGSTSIIIPGVDFYGLLDNQTIIVEIDSVEVIRFINLDQYQTVQWQPSGGIILAAASILEATATTDNGVTATLTPFEVEA